VWDLMPCGFLQLIAGAAGALGGVQQSQTVTSHDAPLLNQDAVRSLLLSSSLSHAQLISLGQSLAWGVHSVGKPLEVCEHHSVRELRALQLEGTRALRCHRHTQYVQQATSGHAPVGVTIRAAVQRLQACLPRIWRMPWDNSYKEALWRLAVNGIPGEGGYGIVHRSACLCGWPPPTLSPPQAAMQLRHHAFWDCPVARCASS
jgi:hypothetical protein